MNLTKDRIRGLLQQVRPTPSREVEISSEEQIEQIQFHFQKIMEILGLNLDNDSLKETPKRVAKMFVNETFAGLRESEFPKITLIENEMGYDQMIVSKNVEIMSTCEHHFVTIDGFATVAYIPNKKVIGLSKINRVARFFSKRPQVQERLTRQIADCLELILETPHVAVQIEARHFCLVSRGIEDKNCSTVTCDLRGDFKTKIETRTEFLNQCQPKS